MSVLHACSKIQNDFKHPKTVRPASGKRKRELGAVRRTVFTKLPPYPGPLSLSQASKEQPSGQECRESEAFADQGLCSGVGRCLNPGATSPGCVAARRSPTLGKPGTAHLGKREG